MNNNRIKLLKLTTISSIVCQIVVVISGLICPRLFIKYYGSSQYGLLQSISHFLSIITFLDLGVGTVVQSSLYGPLAEENDYEISKVMISARHFFRKLAFMYIVYLIILMFLYPIILKNDFNYWYIFAFTFILGYGLFTQYYWGVTNSLLIISDQKGYIINNLQIVTTILNTIICVILIFVKCPLIFVKLISSFIFLIKPMFLIYYVNNNYKIDYTIALIEEPIKQKWNGVAMHISSVILDNTDTIILTIFTCLSDVSIYSIYNFVIIGVKQLFISSTTGMRALLGNLIANQEKEKLLKTFTMFEWFTHTCTTFVFTVTGLLIIPFVSVYTQKINDANYIQPLFGYILVSAHAVHCIRLPYNCLIFASGNFKQTQKIYIFATIINIVVSLIFVKWLGLVGVAIGTFVSLLIQTIWMIIFNSKFIIDYPLNNIYKQFFADIIGIVVIISVSLHFIYKVNSYIEWIKQATIVSILSLICLFLINIILYKDNISNINLLIKARFLNK